MKAKIEVVSGAVRIFDDPRNQLRGYKVEPVHAPHSAELDGEWAVGSASSTGTPLEGEFNVTALEDGKLRVFGADGSSQMVPMKAGGISTFETIEANAYTVSSPEAADPAVPGWAKPAD